MSPDCIFIVSFFYLIIISFDMIYDTVFLQVTSSCGHMILFHHHHFLCLGYSTCFHHGYVYSVCMT